MRKISTVAIDRIENFKSHKLTIGLDLGDRFSHYCILNESGDVIGEQNLPTTPKGIDEVFRRIPRSRIALETGTHSPWVSRQLARLGHEVIVAHARNVRLIGDSSRKDDQVDARTLARLARIDPGLLGPVQHRKGAKPSDGNPRSSGTGQCTHGVGEHRTRVDEIVRRAAAEMWHPENESGYGQRTEPGVEGCLGSAVRRNRIVKRADRGIRPADRANRQGSLSPGCPTQTGEGSRDTHCFDLRSDSGRPTPISPKPGCGMFSGVASWAQELGYESATAPHQQRGRCLLENDAGAGRALHSRAVWTGL